jgi:arylsulfatase A-like enzyme
MPSRASLLTGTYPWQNGVYVIEQEYHDAPALKNTVAIPRYFQQHGYRTLGAGKIYHRPKHDADAWDEWGGSYGWKWMGDLVGPEGVSGLPEPSIFDFGPLPVEDTRMNDAKVTQWAVEKLGDRHEKPFFLAVGLITPHLPLFTPQQYYSLWEESTHVPLVIVAPDGVNVGAECTRPVGLIDIYPTLVELCGLPTKQDLQGNSLVPLLENPSQAWKFPALTTHHPGNHSVRTERWRYIQYANGDEELYDHDADPHEWKNLANDADYAAVKDRLAQHIPKFNAPYAPRQPRQKFTQEFDWSTP